MILPLLPKSTESECAILVLLEQWRSFAWAVHSNNCSEMVFFWLCATTCWAGCLAIVNIKKQFISQSGSKIVFFVYCSCDPCHEASKTTTTNVTPRSKGTNKQKPKLLIGKCFDWAVDVMNIAHCLQRLFSKWIKRCFISCFVSRVCVQLWIVSMPYESFGMVGFQTLLYRRECDALIDA